jgi:aminopeptidase YwaD
VASFRRGLRVMFFSVEEWALTGSAQYVQALSEAERAKIALNVNLDSVAGSPYLAALTSGFGGVERFLLEVAEANGQNLRTVRPLMTNSDHANFAGRRHPRDSPRRRLRRSSGPSTGRADACRHA